MSLLSGIIGFAVGCIAMKLWSDHRSNYYKRSFNKLNNLFVKQQDFLECVFSGSNDLNKGIDEAIESMGD